MSVLKSKLNLLLHTLSQRDQHFIPPPGTGRAITCIIKGAVALISIGQVVAGRPMVAGPGCTLIDVQFTAWALETRHTVTAEVTRIWALGHTQSIVVAGLGGTAPGLCGPAGVAAPLCSLALSPWSAWV